MQINLFNFLIYLAAAMIDPLKLLRSLALQENIEHDLHITWLNMFPKSQVVDYIVLPHIMLSFMKKSDNG